MPKITQTKKRGAFAWVISVQNDFGNLFSGLCAGFIGEAQENSHFVGKTSTVTPLVLSSVSMLR